MFLCLTPTFLGHHRRGRDCLWLWDISPTLEPVSCNPSRCGASTDVEDVRRARSRWGTGAAANADGAASSWMEHRQSAALRKHAAAGRDNPDRKPKAGAAYRGGAGSVVGKPHWVLVYK